MGSSSDKYEPPKESKINDFLKKKEKIVNTHSTNNTLPTSEEIQIVSKMDIDIFEFLIGNINSLEEKKEKTKNKDVLKKIETKLEFYMKKKEKFDELNRQWNELLGYHEEVKKLEKENEEVIKEKLKNKKHRKSIFEREEPEEEEEEEEEIDSKDFYYRSPFYEENPKMVGKNKDQFDSLLQVEKNEEEIMKEKYPFDF